MKKNKYIYTLSALMMACIISFSGVGGSHIQAHATSVGIPRPGAWNDDASVWENIYNYLSLYMSYMGVYVNPSGLYYTAQNFYDFMTSDGVSHDVAHGIFCDCDDSTHTSFSGNEHGGGGFIRDGISVDDDGNVTYSDEVSDLFHDYICNYLETESGYWVVETMAVDEILREWFGEDTDVYNNLVQTIKNIGVTGIRIVGKLSTREVHTIRLASIYDKVLCIGYDCDTLPTSVNYHIYCDSSNVWRSSSIPAHCLPVDTSYQANLYESLKTNSFSLSDFVDANTGYVYFDYFSEREQYDDFEYRYIVSTDGRLIKIWETIDSYRKYNMKQQPYYYTQNWVNYDASQDNSITMTSAEYQYYSDNSTTIFQTIQNNIDNSGSDLTEKDIQKIVEDVVKEIKDSIKDDSGSGDSGNGSTSDNDSGGTGVGDLIEGIGKIFDTILSLIGKLMGVVADFTQSILDLFSGFTTFTDGFSDFLAGAFSFIPAEVWDIIKVGLSLMVLLAVIKFLRK